MPLLTALRSGTVGLRRRLEHLRCWVLAQPRPPVLQGQCCDRLRPGFLALALHQQLVAQHLANAAVVDWRWDSSTGHVQGLLWSGCRLERFHWLPNLPHLVRQPVLELTISRSPLRLATPAQQA